MKKAMKSGVSLQRIWKNKSERLILTFYQKLEKKFEAEIDWDKRSIKYFAYT